MGTFHEKLKNHFAGQGLTQSDVAERLHLSRTIVSNYLNGQKNFGRHSAIKWAKTFGIDEVWLLTQGEQGTPPNQTAPPTTPKADTIEIPMLNLDSRGGFLPNDQSDIEQYTIGTMPFNRSIAHTGDIVVSVYGESMAPRYPAGSYILIRPVEQWREYIELGKTYVLELADWRRVIKIVRKGSDSAHYLLDSYNIDYESTEIATSFINNVWLVVASVNRETMWHKKSTLSIGGLRAYYINLKTIFKLKINTVRIELRFSQRIKSWTQLLYIMSQAKLGKNTEKTAEKPQ